jgi:hypothetical protein
MNNISDVKRALNSRGPKAPYLLAAYGSDARHHTIILINRFPVFQPDAPGKMV